MKVGFQGVVLHHRLMVSFCLSTGDENNRLSRLVKGKAKRRAKNSIVMVFGFSLIKSCLLSLFESHYILYFRIGLFFASLDKAMSAIRLRTRKTNRDF